MADNNKRGYGLRPEALQAVFPFHFAFDRQLRIRQFGPSLHKLLPDLARGARLSEIFRLVTPSVALEFDAIDQQSFTVFFLQSLDQRFKLKGQMLRTRVGNAELILFLGSPVVREMSSVSSIGLNLKDFAIHDSAVDFLILLQTKTNTINDVKSMAERLKKEVGERREAQKELQAINAELEARVLERTAALQSEVAERSRAEEHVREANSRLERMVSRLEEHNRQMQQLNTLGELLQSCRTVDETWPVIGAALASLFPGESGSLALHDPRDGKYRIVAEWGPARGEQHREFSGEDCRALFRNRILFHDPDMGDEVCAHLRREACPPRLQYVCAPLHTQGEVHGLLQLYGTAAAASATDALPDDAENRRQLIHSASEQISLSIANLKLQEHLRQQSIRDMLTGLYNRRHMEASLAREVARADRSGEPCGVILIDVDHFKKFNDTLGHQAGDALLKGLGEFIAHHVRGEDIPCRYGGEEFILILPGASPDGALRRAEQIRIAVESVLKVPYEDGCLPPVTISMGVACYPIHAASAELTIKAADVALYASKQGGRNRVTLSSGSLVKG